MEDKKDGDTFSPERIEEATYDVTSKGKRMLDPDVVKRMKEAGIPRPHDVSKFSWEQVQKVKAGRHTLVAHMAAAGIGPLQISEATGLSHGTVKRYISSPKIQFEIKRIQHQYLGADPMRRFRGMMSEAADTFEETMRDKSVKPSVRLMAADKILDRALGKPKQHITMEGSLIRRIYETLDKGGPVIEVPPAEANVRNVGELPATPEPAPEPAPAQNDRWKDYLDQNL